MLVRVGMCVSAWRCGLSIQHCIFMMQYDKYDDKVDTQIN